MFALAFALCIAVLLIAWRLTVGRAPSVALTLSFAVAALLATALSAPSLWQAVAGGYPLDSFFSLDTFGRAGVLVISTLLMAVFFLLLAWKTRWFLARAGTRAPMRIVLFICDLAAGLALFGFLHSLTPQAYYSFYQFIIPDLPNQIVIKSLFHWDALSRIIALGADDSLSNHLSGVVFRGVIPFTALLHGYQASRQKEREHAVESNALAPLFLLIAAGLLITLNGSFSL